MDISSITRSALHITLLMVMVPPMVDMPVHAGSPPPGDYYRLEPRPVEEFDEAAIKAHREAVGTVAPEGAELREPRPEDIANTASSNAITQ